MSNFIVVYDACVLYSAPLRDLLVELATTGLFRARWTNEIHNEWVRSVLETRPNTSIEKLERTKQLMNNTVLDSLVAGYEALIEGVNLPDPDDRHILAAAIHCGASTIVTKNLKDFPRTELSKYNIEAQHPDIFIEHQINLNPRVVCATVEKIRQRLKNPPKMLDEYLDTLEKQELPKTVNILKEYMYK
jgi:predicted nucleic acid-binding protein